MNILAIAYACEPNRGSEPGVGWNWIRQLGKQEGIKLTVVTRANNKKVIDEFYKKNPADEVVYEYYDLPQSILRFKHGDKGIKLFFTLWQIGVITYIKRHKLYVGIDYVWDLNFGSLALPTFCYKLNKRYFIGPVSTKESIPDAYIKCMKSVDRAKYKIQQFMRTHLWTSPFAWKALRKASFVLTCNEMSRKYLPEGVRSISVFHNGLDLSEDIEINEHKDKPLRLIYSGRLIQSKNIEAAIVAIKQLKEKTDEKIYFSIYGNGPEKEKLQLLVQNYNLDGIIRFCPKVSQEELFQIYRENDIYLFPSLLEISSTSVMEAMYFGLLPICLDINCMEYIINNDSVCKVKNVSLEHDSQEISNEILKLLSNRELLFHKRKECTEIAKNHFVWNKKEDEVLKLVNELKRVK